METKRLFIGVPMDVELMNSVQEFIKMQQPQKGLRWTPVENIHITTFFIGETATNQVDTIISEINYAVAPIPPFSMVMDTFCFAPAQDPYMIWLKFNSNDSFEKLVTGLHRNILNKPASKRDFVPHATLSRFKSSPPFINFEILPATNHFVVSKLVLWESLLKPMGPVYSVIKTFLLK